MTKPKATQLKNNNWFDNLFINPSSPYIIIIVVCILLYIQVLTFGLVHFDDHGFVLLSANRLTLSNIPAFFWHTVFWVFGEANQDIDVYYRPLQNVVYAFCNLLTPKQPFSYHLVSLLFHVFTACALYNFFISIKYQKPMSLLFTLLYCVHPVLVMDVAWIAGLGDEMATLFVLLSVTYFIRLLDDESGLNIKFLFIHLLAFLAALFSKEISLALIPICLFYLFFINKKRIVKSATLSAIAGWIIFATIFLILRSHAVIATQANLLSAAVDSFKVNGLLVFDYIEKIFLPYRLNPMPSRDDAHIVIGPIILLAIVAAFIFKKKISRLALFGLGWFLLFIVPTFIQVNPQTPFYNFEHRLYLPIIGILIVLMELINVLQVKISSRYFKYGFTLLLLLFSVINFSYARMFKDAYGFHDRVISLSPKSSLIYNGYAEILLQDKNYEQAIEMYKKSFEYTPTDLNTSGKIGDIYLNSLGDAPSAIEWFKKTLAINPKTVEAAVSIADAYLSFLHDTTNAVVWYNNSLNINPNNEFALAKLGIIEINKGMPEEGRALLLRALKQNDKSLTALTWVAISYFSGNNIAGAVLYLNRAYSYYPGNVDVQRNLMICYYKLNDPVLTNKFAGIYAESGNQVPAEITSYLQNKK